MTDLAAELPRGDGSAIMVLPSVFRDDAQTQSIRQFLNRLGYQAFGWAIGRNLGPSRFLQQGALVRLGELAARHGPVGLVGFSMGGLFARWLAARSPALVQQVISVGSPLRDPLGSAFVPRSLLELAWSGQDLAALARELEAPLQIPTTSLYSRLDGIVAWESCLADGEANNIEVSCHHVLMPQNPDVFRAVAKCLARNSQVSQVAKT